MTPAQLLAFERQHPTATPDKHARIRNELGISEIRYYVLLARAASSVDGITADPITARMIRERADRRAAKRQARVASFRGFSRSGTRADTLSGSGRLTEKAPSQ